MTPAAIAKFLGYLGVSNASTTKRTGWVVGRCALGPWRHEGGTSGPEVFGVRVEAGDPRANCFACGWHGRLSDLLLEARHLNNTQPRIECDWVEARKVVDEAENEDLTIQVSPDIEQLLESKKELHQFPDWWLESFPPAYGVDWAAAYLKDRGVPYAIASALDIRADTQQRRVCFPVRDFHGVLRGLHGRAVNPNTDPRYRMYLQAKRNNPIVWLGESWVDLAKPVVVVEGPFDLASVYRVYPNVVSPLYANPSVDKLKRMADAYEIITFFDRGAGGDSGRKKFQQVFGKQHLLHHLHPPKGRKDPGECSEDELRVILAEKVQLTAKTI